MDAKDKMKEALKIIFKNGCQLAAIFYLKVLFLAFIAVSVKSEKLHRFLIYKKLGILKLGHYCNQEQTVTFVSKSIGMRNPFYALLILSL
jgi:hypothetical protein